MGKAWWRRILGAQSTKVQRDFLKEGEQEAARATIEIARTDERSHN